MNNTFNFNYYGLKCHTSSASPRFTVLLASKFGGFKPRKTAALLTDKILISFQTSEFLPTISGKIVSSDVVIGQNSIQFIHRYLLTATQVTSVFNKGKLKSIVIHHRAPLMFTILSKLLRNILETQLFQQLIKIYVEQTLLWYLASSKKLGCLHAAAVERNGEVAAFAGLNGAGKSTLAQQLIAKHSYAFFADNYLLYDQKFAYFSPDVVRLDKHSLQLLNRQADSFFGFNKYVSPSIKVSKLKKAPLQALYFVSKGKEWHNVRTQPRRFWDKLTLLLSIHREQIALAPIAQFVPRMIPLIEPKTISYYDLTIGIDREFTKEFL